MKIYIVRHGETDLNVKKLVSGGMSDVHLNETGLRQAKEMAEKIVSSGISVDRMLVSPMIRARETASFIQEKIHVPMEIDERLREFCFGEYEQALIADEVFQSHKRNFTYCFEGGESMLRFAQRIYNCLDDVRRMDAEAVLLVCHGAAGRMIRSYFHSTDDDGFFRFFMDNCEVVCYEIDHLK